MRLLSVIVIFAVFLAFIVLNIDNKCDISLGIKTFREIPVFVSILFSFVLGMLFSLPFGIALSRKIKKTSRTESAAPEKKKLLGKKSRNKDAINNASSAPEEINKENSPYGID